MLASGTALLRHFSTTDRLCIYLCTGALQRATLHCNHVVIVITMMVFFPTTFDTLRIAISPRSPESSKLLITQE